MTKRPTDLVKPPRRVLIIAYYFPPMGLSGVQRVAKLVKYLPQAGWQPVVLTVKPGAYFAFDDTLLREVVASGVHIERTNSWDPTRLISRTSRIVELPSEKKRGLLTAISQYLLLPDNKIGWYPFAVNRGKKLLNQETYDAIYVSAPPYTSLIIGTALSKWANVPLVIDYRDDWLGNPRHTYPTKLHRTLHSVLERWVLRRASYVTAINDVIVKSIEHRHQLSGSKKVAIIPQGFDSADMLNSFDQVTNCTGKFKILYTGVFYDAQKPDTFLYALARAIDVAGIPADRIRATFLGLVPSYFNEMVSKLGLEEVVEYRGYVDHTETVKSMLNADVLWMIIGHRKGAEGISTGKLYEYMGTLKPILALIPNGTARRALKPYKAARICDPDDVLGTTEAMHTLYQEWLQDALPQGDKAYTLRFDRKYLAEEVASMLDKAVAEAI